jgi:hypothetical protein
MSELTIRTNHHERPFLCRNEVLAGILADQFDYQDEDVSNSYFKHLVPFRHVHKTKLW